MKSCLLIVVSIFVVVKVGVPSLLCAAEQLDVTVCYSGTATVFYQSKEVMPSSNWAQNGIITSHTPSKLLDNAVVHCDGVQRGVGPERTGYGLCKIMDDDGDVIIAEIPYSGFTYDMKFLEGTGKWKGNQGLASLRTNRSK